MFEVWLRTVFSEMPREAAIWLRRIRVSGDVVSEAPYAGVQWFTSQSLPVRSIYGYRPNLDQDFIVPRGRFCHLLETKNPWWSVFCVYDRFHKYPFINSLCHLLNADSVFDCRRRIPRAPVPTLLWG